MPPPPNLSKLKWTINIKLINKHSISYCICPHPLPHVYINEDVLQIVFCHPWLPIDCSESMNGIGSMGNPQNVSTLFPQLK